MKQLREILPQTLKNLGIVKKFNLEWAMLHWRKIVGEEIAAHAAPVAVQRGVMVVAVNNSVWMHHLSMMKEEMIAKLNGFIGEKQVLDIRFQAGNLQKFQNSEQDEEKNETLAHKLRKIRLDEQEMQQAHGLAQNIQETGLQKKILKLVQKHMAFKKLKVINHWHKCVQCDSLCPREVQYCTVCAIENRKNKQQAIRQLLTEAPWLTYAELNQYAACTPEEFIDAKTMLIALYSHEIQGGKCEQVKVLTLVMLMTGAKPEEVTEHLIKKTLDKFRRKNYVSTSGL
jgi:hypothetical protein